MIDEIYKISIKNKIKMLTELKQNKKSLKESTNTKSIITYSKLGSLKNRKEIQEMMMTFIEEIENKIADTDSEEEQISDPTYFSLFYIPI